MPSNFNTMSDAQSLAGANRTSEMLGAMSNNASAALAQGNAVRRVSQDETQRMGMQVDAAKAMQRTDLDAQMMSQRDMQKYQSEMQALDRSLTRELADKQGELQKAIQAGDMAKASMVAETMKGIYADQLNFARQAQSNQMLLATGVQADSRAATAKWLDINERILAEYKRKNDAADGVKKTAQTVMPVESLSGVWKDALAKKFDPGAPPLTDTEMRMGPPEVIMQHRGWLNDQELEYVMAIKSGKMPSEEVKKSWTPEFRRTTTMKYVQALRGMKEQVDVLPTEASPSFTSRALAAGAKLKPERSIGQQAEGTLLGLTNPVSMAQNLYTTLGEAWRMGSRLRNTMRTPEQENAMPRFVNELKSHVDAALAMVDSHAFGEEFGTEIRAASNISPAADVAKVAYPVLSSGGDGRRAVVDSRNEWLKGLASRNPLAVQGLTGLFGAPIDPNTPINQPSMNLGY